MIQRNYSKKGLFGRLRGVFNFHKKAKYRCRLLGISAGDDRGWYPEVLLEKLLSTEVRPLSARPAGCNGLYVLGGDAAPGQGNKSDSCFVEVWRAVQVVPSANWTWFDGAKYWHVAPCYAHTFKNVRSWQYAGLIHGLHMRFAFSRIVLDPGGGSAWVYKDLMEREQIIDNQKVQVTPLCTRDEALQSDKQPIVIMFKRGSDLDPLWAPHFLRSDEGLIEAAHRAHRESIEAKEYALPQLLKQRSKADVAGMLPGETWAQRCMDTIFSQTTQVTEKVDSEGRPIVSTRGFKMFGSKIKKDGAYARLYAYCGMKLLIAGNAAMAGEYEEEPAY